jgi:endogenous inhibitor of DNA gyrase (YacG/DUF329 family)
MRVLVSIFCKKKCQREETWMQHYGIGFWKNSCHPIDLSKWLVIHYTILLPSSKQHYGVLDEMTSPRKKYQPV